MATMLWKNSNSKIIKNEKDQLIICDRCPCESGDCYLSVSVTAVTDCVFNENGELVEFNYMDVNVNNHINQSSSVNSYTEYIDCIKNGETYEYLVNIACDKPGIILNIGVFYGNAAGYDFWEESGNWEENIEFSFKVIIKQGNADGDCDIIIEKN